MSRLQKLMYGIETDPKKSLFNIINGQIRPNSILNNAGWFNKDGDRLGYGDISYTDISSISKGLEKGEEFIILSEADTSWNVPAKSNTTSPGRDYVVKHAAWFIFNSGNGVKIFKPSIDYKDKSPETLTTKGISYTKISYKDFFNEIGFLKKAKEEAKNTTMDDLKKEIVDVFNTISKPKKKAAPTNQQQTLIPFSLGGFKTVAVPINKPATTPVIANTKAPSSSKVKTVKK